MLTVTWWYFTASGNGSAPGRGSGVGITIMPSASAVSGSSRRARRRRRRIVVISGELVAVLRADVAHRGDHRGVERARRGGKLLHLPGDEFLPVFIELLDLRLDLRPLLLFLRDVRLALLGRHLLHLGGKILLLHLRDVDRAFLRRVDEVPAAVGVDRLRLGHLALHVRGGRRGEVRVLRVLPRRAGFT